MTGHASLYLYTRVYAGSSGCYQVVQQGVIYAKGNTVNMDRPPLTRVLANRAVIWPRLRFRCPVEKREIPMYYSVSLIRGRCC